MRSVAFSIRYFIELPLGHVDLLFPKRSFTILRSNSVTGHVNLVCGLFIAASLARRAKGQKQTE